MCVQAAVTNTWETWKQQKSEVQVPAGLVSDEGSLLASEVTLSSHNHRGCGWWGNKLPWVTFYKDTDNRSRTAGPADLLPTKESMPPHSGQELGFNDTKV